LSLDDDLDWLWLLSLLFSVVFKTLFIIFSFSKYSTFLPSPKLPGNLASPTFVEEVLLEQVAVVSKITCVDRSDPPLVTGFGGLDPHCSWFRLFSLLLLRGGGTGGTWDPSLVAASSSTSV
jgi:hypothetical protein